MIGVKVTLTGLFEAERAALTRRLEVNGDVQPWALRALEEKLKGAEEGDE